MTVALLLVALHWPADPPPHLPLRPVAVFHPSWRAGNVYRYDLGIFAQVARNRGMALDWTADGFASVPDCRYVNPRRPWYVSASIGGRRLRLQILDCSNPRDLPHQRKLQLILEVDYTTARERGFARTGHAPAVVWGYTQP